MRLRRFLLVLSVPVFLVLGGTLGYRLIEGWPLLDAAYMAVTTLTTVGFREVHPMSPAGLVFTMALALGGVFTMFYSSAAIIGAIARGEVHGEVGRRRMERTLGQLTGHTIVCGYGRRGHLVCEEFSARKRPFVIIERDQAILEGFRLPHGVALAGDATEDAVLRKAGVERAHALVTVAASDADNLYITMSARLLNEKLTIVARAEGEEAEKKLARAGATRVVSPYVIGGQRVAQAVLRPHVMDFLELATRTDYIELQIEETRVEEGSALSGRSIVESRIRQDLGIIVVAIKRGDGSMVFNPASEVVLQPSDLLITLGRPEQLQKLEASARR